MRRIIFVFIACFSLGLAGWGKEALIIPAGTKLVVRTNEAIEATSAAEGTTYSAVVEQSVKDESGATAIPKGANARLIVKKASSGTVTSPDIVLDVFSVNANGKRYMVSTADLERRSERGIGKNRRTAEMIGGGAAVGTIIGAIAGGGKGAAIGAITGAAAGGTAQVLTKGKEVRVPAETVLTFKLDQPLQLTPTT